MPTLPLEQLAQIEQTLDRVEWDNLVLVLSQTAGDDFLLVYNLKPEVQLPASPQPTWQVKRLVGLTSFDYAGFDGLVVGFSAIDVFLPDIPTHGVNFRSLASLAGPDDRRRRQVQKTGFELAKTLLDYLDNLPEFERERQSPRGHAKIIQLALPDLLADLPVQNLVAVRLKRNLHQYLDRDEPCQAIYTTSLKIDTSELYPEQPDEAPDGASWLIAFEEVGMFFHGFEPRSRSFIELRPILREAGLADVLMATCRNLARLCWRLWQASGQAQFMAAAYSLAAEACLAGEDVEHLVAMYPHQDFERFVSTGDALRFYRVPLINQVSTSLVGPRYALGDLVQGQITAPEYATPPLSFPVLAPVLAGICQQQVLDLGPVLWKAGQEAQLSRTLWLLSRDLLNPPGSAWLRINATPAAITEMATRAALIYGLANPWPWQARYPQFLQRCYEHLSRCLSAQAAQAEAAPVAGYYRALSHWYGCYTTDDQERNLHDLVQAGRKFLDNNRLFPDFPEQVQVISRLVNIGESLTAARREGRGRSRDSSGTGPQPFDVTGYLRNAVDSRVTIYPPSAPFESLLQEYQANHAHWRALQEGIGSERPSVEAMSELLANYRRQQRTSHAPAHEQALLRWVCQEDIDRISLLLQAVEIDPIIKISLRTNWVTLNVRERLTVTVENVGGARAYQFRLELGRSRQFVLFSDQASLALEALAPGKPFYLELELESREPILALNFKYSFHDHTGQEYTGQQTLSLEVLQPGASGKKPRGNLYQAGPPVYGWDRFFGRASELQKILTRLSSGITQPILLRGPRRMGKTSILNQIRWLLEKPAEMRRMNLPAEDEAKLQRIRPIFTTLQAINSDRQDYVAYFFQTIFEDICEALELSYDRAQTAQSFAKSPTRAFTKQIDLVFKQRAQVRLLVIIDEWDELNRTEHNHLGANLRSLMETIDQINWIFSSTWTLSVESGKYGSPFYNQTFPIELRQMDWEAAVHLVKAPAEKMDVTWRGEAVVTVLEQTGRRPYLVQLLCSKIIDYLHQKSGNVVEMETVKIVINQFLKEASSGMPYFGFIWSRDENRVESQDNVRWAGRLILWALNNNYPEPLSRLEIRRQIEAEFERYALDLPGQFEREFNEQMTLLEKIFDIINEVEGDRYQFGIPLVQAWFRQTMSRHAQFFSEAHTGLWQDLEDQG